MRPIKDLTGQRFGKLVAVQIQSKSPRVKWLCACDCGNTAVVSRTNLERGTQSCGCVFQDKQPLTWSVEELQAAVQKAKSWEELYELLGGQRGIKSAVKRWIVRLGMETSHFTGEWRTRHKLDDSVVFCENSHHLSSAKRRYYARTVNVCMVCGIAAIWNGNPLRFEIDHKNGNKTDCRWENLQKVCPNCHSQTPTYCGRNRGNNGPEKTF